MKTQTENEYPPIMDEIADAMQRDGHPDYAPPKVAVEIGDSINVTLDGWPYAIISRDGDNRWRADHVTGPTVMGPLSLVMPFVIGRASA